MENLIIGVDHGYAAMKTHHCVFPTGLVEYGHKPYTAKDVLEYDGKYYVVGSNRQKLQKDKMKSDDYYLLTLAAIAKELYYRQAPHAVNIHMAAGLPLASFGRDLEAFRQYLLRDNRPAAFRYDGYDFLITITGVSLFPQGYAAALFQQELMRAASVFLVDIGGWTLDMMRLDGKVPDAETCRSLEQGVIRCLDEIMEHSRRYLGLSITVAQIESVLRGETEGIVESVVRLVHQRAEAYVEQLFRTFDQQGVDVYAVPTIFMGGGAALLKRFMPPAIRPFQSVILDDVTLNAKAYERLTEQLQQRKQRR